MKTVADLKIGDKGLIKGFLDRDLSLKLLEMGCLPGSEVQMTHEAPLKDPICIKVLGYTLAIRKEEAATIILEG